MHSAKRRAIRRASLKKFQNRVVLPSGTEVVPLTGLPFCLHPEPVYMLISHVDTSLPSAHSVDGMLLLFVRPSLELFDAEALFAELPHGSGFHYFDWTLIGQTGRNVVRGNL